MPPDNKKKTSRAKPRRPARPTAAGWTFLTNHAHVLVLLARDPGMRLRDVAVGVGITERAVQKIVAELEAGGIIRRERNGRRNRYEIHRSTPLRHPVEAHRNVGHILAAILRGHTPKE